MALSCGIYSCWEFIGAPTYHVLSKSHYYEKGQLPSLVLRLWELDLLLHIFSQVFTFLTS